MDLLAAVTWHMPNLVTEWPVARWHGVPSAGEYHIYCNTWRQLSVSKNLVVVSKLMVKILYYVLRDDAVRFLHVLYLASWHVVF